MDEEEGVHLSHRTGIWAIKPQGNSFEPIFLKRTQGNLSLFNGSALRKMKKEKKTQKRRKDSEKGEKDSEKGEKDSEKRVWQKKGGR